MRPLLTPGGRTEDLLLRVLVRALHRAPAGAGDRIAVALAPLLSLARTPLRRLEQNVGHVLGLEPESPELRAFRRRVLRHHVACTFETYKAALEGPSVLRVEGVDALRRQVRAIEGSRGQVHITGHLGSWELVGSFLAASGRRPYHALAKATPSQRLNKLLDRMRSNLGMSVLWTHDSSTVRRMFAAVRRGETVGFVMDQRPEGPGALVRFLGLETPFVTGPATLAIRTGAPVLAAFCIRRGRLHYEVATRLLAHSDHGIGSVEELTQRMATAIEEAVRVWPEQWNWGYRRWSDEALRGSPGPRAVSVSPR